MGLGLTYTTSQPLRCRPVLTGVFITVSSGTRLHSLPNTRHWSTGHPSFQTNNFNLEKSYIFLVKIYLSKNTLIRFSRSQTFGSRQCEKVHESPL